MRKQNAGDAQVVAQQIAFGESELREVDFSQIRQRDAAAVDLNGRIVRVGRDGDGGGASGTIRHAALIPPQSALLRCPCHAPSGLRVFGYTVPGYQFLRVSASAAIVGLVAITIYLVVERAVAEHLSVVICLQQLLQWDASNAYGARAFDGGWPMAIVGLAMDVVVSFVWAALFTALYGMLPALRRYTVFSGLCFGAVVMVVMLYAVVPLGHATQMRSTLWHVVNVLIAHSAFFGLPISITVSALMKPERPRQQNPLRAA